MTLKYLALIGLLASFALALNGCGEEPEEPMAPQSEEPMESPEAPEKETEGTTQQY